jgi:hypothetical protein
MMKLLMNMLCSKRSLNMAYEELKGYFLDFHLGKITKLELTAAITLYQRGNGK